jgi:hypothetical protein
MRARECRAAGVAKFQPQTLSISHLPISLSLVSAAEDFAFFTQGSNTAGPPPHPHSDYLIWALLGYSINFEK